MPALIYRKKQPWVKDMQTALQAMDVALKQTVSLRNETKVFARAIFWRDDTKSRSLGDGAEVIPPPCDFKTKEKNLLQRITTVAKEL